MFETITWLVTNKCGNKCEYCLFRDRTKEASSPDRIEALRIFSTWPDADKRFICLLGGDIIYVNDVLPFVQYMNKKRLPYGFQTSAAYPKAMQQVLPYLTNLSISVDANITDKYRFKKMLDGIYWAGAVRSLHPHPLDVHATITIDPTNLKDLPMVVEVLTGLEIWTELTFTHWKKGTFDLVPNRLIALSGKNYFHEELVAASEKMIEMKKKGYLIHSSEKFIAAWPKYVPNLSWKCTKPSNCVVDADMTMRCCLHLPGRRVRAWTIYDLKNPSEWGAFLADWKADQEDYCPQCFWDCQYEIDQVEDQKTVDGWFSHRG